MPENPKVFISYSHDSPEHKQWVLDLSTKLCDNGVDVILDQWGHSLGDDRTVFMEDGIRDSERILVICTENYVKKANARRDGAGYEGMILTAELAENLHTNKYIPIIRQASGKNTTPSFLGTRVYIDFRSENQFDERFNELLREIHQVPFVKKPPLGNSPFTKRLFGQEVPSFERGTLQLPEIPQQVQSASDVYSVAFEIARAGDILGWRKLLTLIKPMVFNSLVEWRKNELTGQKPESGEFLAEIIDKAVEIISPLIAVALVGAESGDEKFSDPRSLIDDLLNIPQWNTVRKTFWWIDSPDSLIYVYHSLHGSLSINLNRGDSALGLARAGIPLPDKVSHVELWKASWLMGFSNSLGDDCIKGWRYLSTAHKRWAWLHLVFSNELEYQTSLVAYYMALHIHDLASVIASSQQDTLITGSEGYFTVPLTFLSEGADITQRAASLLRRNPEALVELWSSLNVTREQMEASWGDWIDLVKNRLWRTHNARFSVAACLDILRNFFEDL